MKLKQFFGGLLICLGGLLFLLLTMAIGYLLSNPKLVKWFTSSWFVYLLFYGGAYLLFKKGRKLYQEYSEMKS